MHPERTRMGTIARRGAAYGVLAIAALIVLRLLVGVVAGIVQTAMTLVLLAAVAVAVVWAMRRL